VQTTNTAYRLEQTKLHQTHLCIQSGVNSDQFCKIHWANNKAHTVQPCRLTLSRCGQLWPKYLRPASDNCHKCTTISSPWCDAT